MAMDIKVRDLFAVTGVGTAWWAGSKELARRLAAWRRKLAKRDQDEVEETEETEGGRKAKAKAKKPEEAERGGLGAGLWAVIALVGLGPALLFLGAIAPYAGWALLVASVLWSVTALALAPAPAPAAAADDQFEEDEEFEEDGGELADDDEPEEDHEDQAVEDERLGERIPDPADAARRAERLRLWVEGEVFAARHEGRTGIHLSQLIAAYHEQGGSRPLTEDELASLLGDLGVPVGPLTLGPKNARVNRRGVRYDRLTEALGREPHRPARLVVAHTPVEATA
ncbi:hypothetical protein ACFWIQ_36345 [Kitasatospora sp. NPDC127059]|uniref:hypothetical protein n=1 Tax=Kitasatospora sp. NPDC127059 TaxID=3347120 RepID=UPI003650D770